MVSGQEKGRPKKLRGRHGTPSERERHRVCHEKGRGRQDASDAWVPARATPTHGCKRGPPPGVGRGAAIEKKGGEGTNRGEEERESERVERERGGTDRSHRWKNTGRWLLGSPIDLHATGSRVGYA